jgi:hypothetical protein
MTEVEFNKIVDLIHCVLVENIPLALADSSSDLPRLPGPPGPPSNPEQSSSLHATTQVINLSVPSSQMHKRNEICTRKILLLILLHYTELTLMSF